MMTLDTFATVLVLGLVVYRISRILPVDAVAEPVRARVEMWTYPEAAPSRPKFREWVGQLLSCPVCLSWWIAAVVVIFWSLVVVGVWPGWFFLILWPAVAAVSAVTALVVDE